MPRPTFTEVLMPWNGNNGMKVRRCLWLALIVLVLQMCARSTLAQTAASRAGTGALRGQVTDPSGAAIAHADVVLTPADTSAALIKTQTDGQGMYEFKGLPAGQYSLTVVAEGFAVYGNDNIVITLSQPLRLNVAMKIEVEQEKFKFSYTLPTVTVNPPNNPGPISI